MDFQDKNYHWISMLEASRLCAYSQEYLSLLARRGKIFSKKIGRNWYTTREAIDAYLKTQSVFVSLPKNVFGRLTSSLTPEEPEKGEPVKHAEHSKIFEEFERLNLPILYPQKEDQQNRGSSIVQPNSEKNLETIGMQVVDTNNTQDPVLKKLDRLSGSLELFADRVTKKLEESSPEFLTSEQKEFFDIEIPSFGHRFKMFDRYARSMMRNPIRMTVIMITAIVAIFIVAGGFSFGQVDNVVQQIKKTFKDADMVQGHFPGTHANEVLVLDKAGNVSIFGHIETQGQLRSYAPDGVAPIVVDSMTLVDNLNANYLDGLASKDFTLAFVTKNGNLTYEDVFLEGNVEVGKTLIVKGATKLLDSLQVNGGLGVFGDAIFGKDITVTNGNLILKKGTITINDSSLIKNLNAEFLDGIRKQNINLDFVTSNGASTTNGITIGGLEVNGQSDFNAPGFFHEGVWGSDGAFGTLGVAGDVSIGNKEKSENSHFEVYSKKFKVDQDGKLTITDLVVSKILSDLIPSGSYDLGSAANPWDEIIATSVSFSKFVVSGDINIIGVTSSSFRINTDNISSDSEDSYLAFERGTTTPNSTLKWNSTNNRFEFNQSVRIASSSATLFEVSGGAASISNTLYVQSSGNVGIGTTAPTSKLEVLGGRLEVGGTASASYLLTTNTLQVGGGSSVAYSRFGTSTTTHSGNITTTNDVLISGDLEVDGNAYFDGTVNFAGISSSSLFYAQPGTAASPSFSFAIDQDTGMFRPAVNQLGFSTLGVQRMRIDAGGNVGIGQDPESDKKFTVTGDSRFTGSVFINGNGSHPAFWMDQNAGATVVKLDTNGSSYLNGGNVGIGTTSPTTKFEVQGTASASYLLTGNTLQVGGFSSVAYSRFGTSTTGHANYISTTNDLLISGDLEVDGSISAQFASVSQMFIANNTASASVFFRGNGSGAVNQSNFSIGLGNGTERLSVFDNVNSPIVTIASTGNVGIGTTEPVSLLQLKATNPVFEISSLVNDATGGKIRLTEVNWVGGYIHYDGSANVLNIGMHETNDKLIASDTPAISILRSNGNVGIGNTSPETKLDISGTASASLMYSGAGTAASPSFAFAIDQDTGMFRPAVNQLGFSTLGVQRMRIDAGGNIGIGQDPESDKKFTVTGDSRFTGSVFINGNGSHPAFWMDQNAGATVVKLDTNGSSYLNGGNVGIGTTSPTTKFEVQGTASASYLLTGNTLQVGGFASVAYSRFGTGTTGHANYITTTNDLLISGDLEVDGSISAQFASVSQMFIANNTASASAFFRGNGSGGTNQSNFSIGLGNGTERLNIFNNVNSPIVTVASTGNVGIGTTEPTGKLTIGSGQILAPEGSATSPSFSFNGNTDTGIYAVGNNLKFSVAEVEQGRFTTSGLSVQSGTAMLPSITNISNQDVGLFFAAGVVGMSVTSVENSRFTATGFQPSYGSANTLAYIINARKSRGTVASPTVITSGDDLLTLSGYGYVGTTNTYQEATQILFDSTGTISDSVTGIAGIIRFLTANTGSEPAERLTILNGGNVGIGTTTPSSLLTVQGRGEFQGTASASYLLTGNTLQVGGFASVAYSRFGTGTSSELHYITGANDLFITEDLEVDGSVSFAGPASISNTFYVSTLGKTGNVGIGESLPTALLEIKGGVASISNTLFVENGGNVGIGTTSPGATAPNGFTIARSLEIKTANTNQNNSILLRRSDNGSGLDIAADNVSTANIYFDSRYDLDSETLGGFQFRVRTAGTAVDVMRITNQARVGIGTTTPSSLLTVQGRGEIQGTASASYLLTGNTLQVGGFSSVAYSRFGTSTTGHANYISTTNDLLISGDLEVDGSISAQFASVSQMFIANNTASASAFFRGNGSGGTNQSNFSIGVGNGTERLNIFNDTNSPIVTIASTGNVGIGTTAPNRKLIIIDTGAAFAQFIGDTDTTNGLVFGYDTAGSTNAYIHNTYTGLSTSAINLGFGATPGTNTVMTLLQDGNVGIGTTSPVQTLHVTGTARITTSVAVTDDRTLCTIAASGEVEFVNGACGTSSRRYKENIKELGYGLEEIKLLKPAFFNYLKDSDAPSDLSLKDDRTKRRIGFIAEDMQLVIPEAVIWQDGQIESIDLAHLTALLTRGVQELDTRTSSLSFRMDELERKIGSSSGEMITVTSGNAVTDVLGTLISAATTKVQTLWASGDVIAEGIKKTYYAMADMTIFKDLNITDWGSREITISLDAPAETASLFSGNGVQAAEQSKVDLQENGAYLATYGIDSTRGEIVLSGSSNLIGGEAKIFFDFSFSSVISPKVPLRIFITPTTFIQGQIYVSDKTPYGFVVKGLNGALDGKFDWLVIARRKGFEAKILDLNIQTFKDLNTASESLNMPSPTLESTPEPYPSATASGSMEFIAPSTTPTSESLLESSPSPTPEATPEHIPVLTESPTPTPDSTPTTTPEI